MSYSRWMWDCDWHILANTNGELSVWNCNNEYSTNYSDDAIKHMLEKDDFSMVKGYKKKDHDFLKGIFEQYIKDYKKEFRK